MKKRQKPLTDEWWDLIGPLFSKPDGEGTTGVAHRRQTGRIMRAFCGQAGAAWRVLLDEFPSASTCWRRLRQWGRTRRLAVSVANIARRPGRRGTVEMGRSLSGRQPCSGEKGAKQLAKPSVARARSG
jgi:transposase